MLTVICGEDNVNSRKYFQQLKEDYGKKSYEIKNLGWRDISELKKWLLESPSLFFQKRAYFSENILKSIKKKQNSEIFTDLEEIANMQDVDLIDWEDSSTSRELKAPKKAKIKEFKPSENIFKLTDACFPSNKKQFCLLLNQVANNNDENFIFIMLVRHIRHLILAKEGVMPPKLQTWQFRKLEFQARFWPKQKLIKFYKALFRVEKRLKTSTNPLPLKESLDILACYTL